MARRSKKVRPSPESSAYRSATRRQAYPSATGRQAFTLIELMVVIFIIGILIALVVGVGKYVYDEAARKETQSTLAIVVEAIEAYNSIADVYPADSGVGSYPDGSDEALLYQLLDNPAAVVPMRESQAVRIVDACKPILLKLPSDAYDGTALRDAYGAELEYDADGGFGGRPVVISLGADGQLDTEDDIRSDR